MSKEHKITTVNDMVKCTNAHNLKRFIADLEAFLSLTHDLPDIVREHSQWGFSWIDDKKRSIEISIEKESEYCKCGLPKGGSTPYNCNRTDCDQPFN